MFHLPDAKRVRRDDLLQQGERSSSPGAASSDGEQSANAGHAADLGRARLAAALDAELQAMFEFETIDPAVEDAGPGPAEAQTQEVQDSAFAFRLFATQDSSGVNVVLPPAKQSAAGAGPDGDPSAGGIVRARPPAYYLATPSAEDAARYAAAAVSGEELMKRSGARCWGLEAPWRVTRITASRKEMRVLLEKGGGVGVAVQSAPGEGADEMSEDEMEEESKPKRKRPGKKRRIVLRTREKVKKEKAETALKARAAKEEHVREKKTRLNRERKLKRRQKARDEKAATKGAGSEVPDGEAGDAASASEGDATE